MNFSPRRPPQRRRVPCFLCGKGGLLQWRDGRPPAHVRCRGTGELADDLLALKERFPRVTVWRMAFDFGFGLSTMQRLLRWGMERRREARAA